MIPCYCLYEYFCHTPLGRYTSAGCLAAAGRDGPCAAVRLSPLWVSTPVGENLVEKGHEPREAQQVEHSAAGVSRGPHGSSGLWMRRAVAVRKGTKKGSGRDATALHG